MEENIINVDVVPHIEEENIVTVDVVEVIPNITNVDVVPIITEEPKKKKIYIKKKQNISSDNPDNQESDKTIAKKEIHYYELDISEIPKYVEIFNKFIDLHPEFFSTKVNTKYIYINDNQIYNIFKEPVSFHDTLHGIKGFIKMSYDSEAKKLTYLISIRSPLKEQKTFTESYLAKIEKYVNTQLVSGNMVSLYYNKILSDTIIKYNFYNQSVVQWENDVKTLQNEFFLNNKDYLLAIMNNKVNSSGINSTNTSWNNMILHGKPGTGKCLGYNTPVMMYNGSIKMVQDIVVDDLVMGDDSTPRTVKSLARGQETMYEITHGKQYQSEKYIVNESHIMSFITWDGDRANDSRYVDMSVKDYLELSDRERSHLHGYETSVKFPKRNNTINSYLYGVVIANHNCDLKYKNNEILKKYETIIDNVAQSLKDINVIDDEETQYFDFIDSKYKYDCPMNLFKLLAGIVDTIGVYMPKTQTYKIPLLSDRLNRDLIFIVRSLGLDITTKSEMAKSFYISGDIHKIHYYSGVIELNYGNTSIPNYNQLIRKERYICIKKLDVADYYGFELDMNQRFVLGNFIVTHNSSFINRAAMILKLSITSIDLSLFLNKKRELYALLHGQEFYLPNGTEKQPALTNCIIALEEFDTAIERILDIENIFTYKDIIKRNYLDLKNAEIKETVKKYIKDSVPQKVEIKKSKDISGIDMSKDMDENDMLAQLMMDDGIDSKSHSVMNNIRNEFLDKRSHDNEINSINIELNNIIKSMDDDNKSNILRKADLLELFQPAVPIKNRIIIGSTNHYDKIKNHFPALFRSGRMSNIEFGYLDWSTLNNLTQYYFKSQMTIGEFEITIPTSQIIELAIRFNLTSGNFQQFQTELMNLCKL
jgi:hypothetical protein